jgi:hypothetical protein
MDRTTQLSELPHDHPTRLSKFQVAVDPETDDSDLRIARNLCSPK